jgi:flagellar biosynthesis protein FliQ
MKYNIIVVISLVICAIISLVISYCVALISIEETSKFFKVIQLIVAVACMTTFYAPIKFVLSKYFNVSKDESES